MLAETEVLGPDVEYGSAPAKSHGVVDNTATRLAGALPNSNPLIDDT